MAEILPELDDYNWEAAFEYVGDETPPGETTWRNYTGAPNIESANPLKSVSKEPFTRADVVRIIALSEGERDERDWVGVFELRDGRFASVVACCDYTGWDCQASGEGFVAATKDEILRFGITDAHRERLGIVLVDAGDA